MNANQSAPDQGKIPYTTKLYYNYVTKRSHSEQNQNVAAVCVSNGPLLVLSSFYK